MLPTSGFVPVAQGCAITESMGKESRRGLELGLVTHEADRGLVGHVAQDRSSPPVMGALLELLTDGHERPRLRAGHRAGGRCGHCPSLPDTAVPGRTGSAGEPWSPSGRTRG